MALEFFKYIKDGETIYVKESDTAFYRISANSFDVIRKEVFQSDGCLIQLEPSTMEEYSEAFVSWFDSK